MKFAKAVYTVAGIYSILILTPFFFLYRQIGRYSPPAITHPEYFYGFVVVGLAFAVCFLIIAANPARLRPAMLATIVEKLGYGLASLCLFLAGRTPWQQMTFAVIDAIFGALFVVVYLTVPVQQ